MIISDPIPVILCGKTTQIGTGVIANLKPEYECTVLSLSFPTLSLLLSL